jgi:hypothetical protein
MRTYQDWLEYANKTEQERMSFIRSAINDHKGSTGYRRAKTGEDYYAGNNTTIRQFEKIIYNAKAQAIPDYTGANHKIASRFFFRDVTQANAVLLGNGIRWKEGIGGEVLGKDFDRKVIDAGRTAQVEGSAFGFFNNGRVDIFDLTEFVPFYDEEDGALKAGIRFWQLADNKPLRATMFELDGYTEYMWDKGGNASIKQEKRGYIAEIGISEADGEEIYDYKNYPTFPIVPLYANDMRQSELVPLRATIDCIDLISSSYANDVDQANIIYWTVTNASGMSDGDLVRMLDKLKKLHAAQVDDDQVLTPNNVEPAYESREALLERLEKQLYKDAMALDTTDIASGAVTATQIEAAYEPLNEKLDLFEAQVTDFIHRLLAVAGVEDDPVYERSIMINKTETINSITAGALYLDDEYVTEKIMTVLGDKDKVQDVLDKKAEGDLNRLTGGADANTETE